MIHFLHFGTVGILLHYI